MLLPALQKVEGSCVIDGEICALDAEGRSRFQLLQNALNKKAKLLYVVFDTLFVDSNDIRQKPLLERKEILKGLLPRDPLLRYSEHVAEFGKREFAKAQRAHEEGVIAKRAAGFYYSGKRTREWLKFKAVHEQEVVIVGYTEPRRSRKYFGSLVLAVRDKTQKRWVYAGHVGTGFDRAALKSLYGMMLPLRTDKKPFDQRVKDESATTWVIPKLVGRGKIHRVDESPRCGIPSFLGSAPTKRRSTSSANKHEINFSETDAVGSPLVHRCCVSSPLNPPLTTFTQKEGSHEADLRKAAHASGIERVDFKVVPLAGSNNVRAGQID